MNQKGKIIFCASSVVVGVRSALNVDPRKD